MSDTRIKTKLVDKPIDTDLLSRVVSEDGGANVVFFGTVRKTTGDVQTDWLEYDCYSAMAESELRKITAKAESEWPVCKGLVVHRMGKVDICEPSIAVAVSTPHRQDAFEAAQWIMDSIKQSVPIWKKECLANNDSKWVHHGERPKSTG